jgi:hypothetical protein
VKHIETGAMHAVVAQRVQDGAVGFFYTRDPLNWLAAIGNHFQLGETEVRPAAAGARVVDYLRARFQFAHVPSDALPWYLIDYLQAIEALDRVDLRTGELQRLPIDTRVMVMPHRVRGRVLGFTHGDRVVVKLDCTRFTENLVIAARDQVKPILRAVAAL